MITNREQAKAFVIERKKVSRNKINAATGISMSTLANYFIKDGGYNTLKEKKIINYLNTLPQ